MQHQYLTRPIRIAVSACLRSGTCNAVEASSQRYVPPAARAAAQSATGQTSQLQRRVRGLLNRMSDRNLPGIVADVLQLAEQEGERAISDAVTAELLQVSLMVCDLL